MKRKPKKLTLQRETIQKLTPGLLSQVVGQDLQRSIAPGCQTNLCHTVLCNGNDTGTSCNVFSCATCIIATCGCDTLVDQCGAG